MTLIRLALEGLPAARRRLAERVDPWIRDRVRKCLNGHGVGANSQDDVAQRVWVRLLDKHGHRLRSFDPDRGSMEQFVKMIAENEIVELIRRPSREETVAHFPDLHTVQDTAPGPEQRVEAKEQALRLRAYLLSVLPVKGQLVLRLLYDDRRSEDEAAEIMCVSKQVVANWKHKIKVHALDFQKNQG